MSPALEEAAVRELAKVEDINLQDDTGKTALMCYQKSQSRHIFEHLAKFLRVIHSSRSLIAVENARSPTYACHTEAACGTRLNSRWKAPRHPKF